MPGIQLTEGLLKLYSFRGIRICESYRKIINDHLIKDISYTSPLMEGLVRTTFQSSLLMAFNLMQNAIDEAKGAARIGIIAEKYSEGNLKKLMLRHVGDEMRHSSQFANLISTTGYNFEEDTSEGVKREIEDVYDFDDDLKLFIFRVHSIEVRSWTMLRLYLSALEDKGEEFMTDFQATLRLILADEVNHVLYTGEQSSKWIKEDPKLSDAFIECIHHTDRETWTDMSSMSLYMAENARNVRLQDAQITIKR